MRNIGRTAWYLLGVAALILLVLFTLGALGVGREDDTNGCPPGEIRDDGICREFVPLDEQ